MSSSTTKLSPALKACINASSARPGTLAAPPGIAAVYERIRREAVAKGVGRRPWIVVMTATSMTMNSPESLTELWKLATGSSTSSTTTTTTAAGSNEVSPNSTPSSSGEEDLAGGVRVAELMREVGLKCISFNGIPRTINCLGAFRASLPQDIVDALSKSPSREPSPNNITSIRTRGYSVWDSIYAPFSAKLISKLADSHPDLPVHILNSHYGALLSDPPQLSATSSKVGRVLTSIAAIACLRAQTGVGPQVISHVFGLRKAYQDGSAEWEGESEVEGGKWLASDEGSLWMLKSVDDVVEAISRGSGSSFAPVRAKL